MPLPKYKINDQVIVISKSDDVSYSLGIIEGASKNSGGWKYFVLTRLDGSIVRQEFPEDYILGFVFESKDIVLNPELKKSEDAINL